MTTTPDSRERLLKAANELFYRDGVGAVGVDKLCKAAGISKKSMYQLFDTKNDVVAAALERYGPWYLAMYLPDESDDRSPRDRVLHVFDWLDGRSSAPEFTGCPFVNIATELRDPDHPASTVARRFKQHLTDFFERQAELGGAADPQLLARQLTVVFDGACASAIVRAEGLAGLSRATAAALLNAARMDTDPATTPR
ncbi:TetR/AcrR family transcriptional regulator [Actinocrispum wychmicini]|uniref:TetR family transcriptional regulator n=1 Tax=Actinocrispum wychmicini TaxID=1213861 RepID=A0A4V2S4W2_9PSEU|nr:TetR/AcrR family transcriptional regulator [Actinocrispum wychmicini]TCO49740.1 TetR family transcriptional regulator [Actinocrispum wychmicini]